MVTIKTPERLLFTLNIVFCLSIIKFEQVNVCWKFSNKVTGRMQIDTTLVSLLIDANSETIET